MVRQFCDEGVRHVHECLTHITGIDAPFPVVGVRLTNDKCITHTNVTINTNILLLVQLRLFSECYDKH